MNAIIERSEHPASWALRFTLGDWKTRASVRTSEHDYLLPPDLEQQLETRHWFPPAFLAYLKHPAIEALGQTVIHRLSCISSTTPPCSNTASSTEPWKPSSMVN
jgi:hypothetical protein